MKPSLRRSNAPIFWALFGAGGMLAALAGPALVAITGVLVPLRVGFTADAMAYANMLALTRHWTLRALLFAVVSLFLWHAAHRILHTLHDLGIPAGTAARLACYGGALLGTLASAAALLALGG